MAHGDRRKCKCCLKLFRPDPRSRHHQRYCSVPACRAASKVASQAPWFAKPENQDYFRGLDKRRPGPHVAVAIRALPAARTVCCGWAKTFSAQPGRVRSLLTRGTGGD